MANAGMATVYGTLRDGRDVYVVDQEMRKITGPTTESGADDVLRTIQPGRKLGHSRQ